MKKLVIAAALMTLAGCVTPQMREGHLQLPPDAGEVAKKHIIVGKTTKKEVLERFGAPDSKMKGEEIPSAGAKDIWVYKDIRSSNYGSNVSLLVAGGSSSTSLSERVTVVIYFDDRDVVKEISSKKMQE